MSLEVRIPVSDRVRNAVLQAEWKQHVAKIARTPTTDVLGRYDQMGTIGKMLKAIFLRENHAREKAFQNPDMMKFLKRFIQVAKVRAKELGIHYRDLEVSTDSGITENGIIEVRFIARPGAERIAR